MTVLLNSDAERKRRLAAQDSTSILGTAAPKQQTVAAGSKIAPKPTTKVTTTTPTKTISTPAPAPAAPPPPSTSILAPPRAPAPATAPTGTTQTPAKPVPAVPTISTTPAKTTSPTSLIGSGAGGARGGMANEPGGGITVTGPGNRGDTGLIGQLSPTALGRIRQAGTGTAVNDPVGPGGTPITRGSGETPGDVVNGNIGSGFVGDTNRGTPGQYGDAGFADSDWADGIIGNDDNGKGTGTSTQPSIDDLIESHIRSSLTGNGDSLEEENALRQQQSDRLLGAGLVNQRASMGRAGFASSGALGAMEGDLRSKAALDLADSMITSREREQNQTFGQKQGVVSSDIAMREAANREAILKAQADALKAILGGGGDDGAGDGDDGAGDAGLGLGAIFPDKDGDQTRTASSGMPQTEADRQALPEMASPPPGGRPIYVGGTGADGYTVYSYSDGATERYVRVPNS